jgi:putative Holliday junction resolvase
VTALKTTVPSSRSLAARTSRRSWSVSLSGAYGPAARAVREEVEELRSSAGAGLEVLLHDERLTTVTAEAALRQGRLRRDERRHVVDKVAAAVMLQAWLESGDR